jgi:hypothetical protein
MTSPYRIERDRGTKEARQRLAELRGEMAACVSGRASSSSAGDGRRPPDRLGNGQAVLGHDQRIALDGAPAETVDAEAKDLATKQLAQLARKAAKKAVEAAGPAVPKPKHAPAPPTKPPEQLRDRVRAGLLRRH